MKACSNLSCNGCRPTNWLLQMKLFCQQKCGVLEKYTKGKNGPCLVSVLKKQKKA